MVKVMSQVLLLFFSMAMSQISFASLKNGLLAHPKSKTKSCKALVFPAWERFYSKEKGVGNFGNWIDPNNRMKVPLEVDVLGETGYIFHQFNNGPNQNTYAAYMGLGIWNIKRIKKPNSKKAEAEISEYVERLSRSADVVRGTKYLDEVSSAIFYFYSKKLKSWVLASPYDPGIHHFEIQNFNQLNRGVLNQKFELFYREVKALYIARQDYLELFGREFSESIFRETIKKFAIFHIPRRGKEDDKSLQDYSDPQSSTGWMLNFY